MVNHCPVCGGVKSLNRPSHTMRVSLGPFRMCTCQPTPAQERHEPRTFLSPVGLPRAQAFLLRRDREGNVVAREPLDPALLRPIVDGFGRQLQPPFTAWEYRLPDKPACAYTLDEIEVERKDESPPSSLAQALCEPVRHLPRKKIEGEVAHHKVVTAFPAQDHEELTEVGQLYGKSLYVRLDWRDPETATYELEQIRSAVRDIFARMEGYDSWQAKVKEVRESQ